MRIRVLHTFGYSEYYLYSVRMNEKFMKIVNFLAEMMDVNIRIMPE